MSNTENATPSPVSASDVPVSTEAAVKTAPRTRKQAPAATAPTLALKGEKLVGEISLAFPGAEHSPNHRQKGAGTSDIVWSVDGKSLPAGTSIGGTFTTAPDGTPQFLLTLNGGILQDATAKGATVGGDATALATYKAVVAFLRRRKVHCPGSRGWATPEQVAAQIMPKIVLPALNLTDVRPSNGRSNLRPSSGSARTSVL